MPTKFAVPPKAESFQLHIGRSGVTYIHFLDSNGQKTGQQVFLLAERNLALFQEPVSADRTFELPSPDDISSFIVSATFRSLKEAGLNRLPNVHWNAAAA